MTSVLLVAPGAAAGQDWLGPPVAYSSRDLDTSYQEPARLPPIGLVSFEEVTTEPVEEPLDIFIGYDDGFVIANHGEDSVVDDYPFLMRVNGWFHLRHTLFDSDGPNRDQNSFSFERLRLSFGGHAFTQNLDYFLQLDGNSDNSTAVSFLDYFISFDLGRELFCCEPGTLGVRAGKWKVPFSRSREESGRRLQFTDRASANVFFDLNRTVGIGLYGRLDPLHPFQFETAVFNGFRTGSASTDRANGQLDNNFGWSMRSYTDLGSEFGSDGEPDLGWHTRPALRLGTGTALVRIDAIGTTEFNRQSVVDSGVTLASILPAGVTAYDLWLSTVDAHFKYRGFSLIAEYYWRRVSQFEGVNVPRLVDDGFVLQGGYFLQREKLELTCRWSRLRGDSGTLGILDQSSDEVGGGLVWYIKGHNAKLTFDVTHHNGAPIGESRIDTLPGDIGWFYRTQLQLAF